MAEQKIEARVQGEDIALNIGDDIVIDFVYSTDTGVKSSGIDFQAFFNSKELRFNGLTVNTAAGGSPFTEENLNDSSDRDGNPDTDKFIGYNTGNPATNFPTTQPVTLYTANFKVLPGFDGITSIDFIGTAGKDTNNALFNFTPVSLNLTADQPVRIKQGQEIDDLTAEENAPDSVIDLSTIFEDPDGDAIAYSVVSNTPSLVTARIEGTNLILDYQDGQFGASEVTVTASGGGTFEDSDFVVNVTDNPDSSNLNLDVDGSGAATFARDSLLISAFLFFYNFDRTDYRVLNKFILDSAATRQTGTDIANYLKSGLTVIDADGSGATTFARDGLLISAFLFFYNFDRTDYSILDKFILDSAATRQTGNEVAEYLKSLLPTALIADLDSDNRNLNSSSNLIGTVGNDILTGDAGNNNLFGDAGDDLLTGGLGADTFRFALNSGDDTVTDFRIDEDLILIDPNLGFSTGSEVFAAIASKGIIDGQFSSELNLGANGTVIILHDRPLTINNFVVI